jgi:hypothetical protein
MVFNMAVSSLRGSRDGVLADPSIMAARLGVAR